MNYNTVNPRNRNYRCTIIICKCKKIFVYTTMALPGIMGEKVERKGWVRPELLF